MPPDQNKNILILDIKTSIENKKYSNFNLKKLGYSPLFVLDRPDNNLKYEIADYDNKILMSKSKHKVTNQENHIFIAQEKSTEAQNFPEKGSRYQIKFREKLDLKNPFIYSSIQHLNEKKIDLQGVFYYEPARIPIFKNITSIKKRLEKHSYQSITKFMDKNLFEWILSHKKNASEISAMFYTDDISSVIEMEFPKSAIDIHEEISRINYLQRHLHTFVIDNKDILKVYFYFHFNMQNHPVYCFITDHESEFQKATSKIENTETGTMELALHGVRGSRPTHKNNLLVHGGNSTSMELMFEKKPIHLFIDGGSGLAVRGRNLGQYSKKTSFHFLITHTHWDHLLGLPFFEPLYSEENEFTFYASETSKSNFNDIFFGIQRSTNLPIPSSQFNAKINFVSINPDENFVLEDNINISTFQLNHQGITLGYKINYGNHSFAIITDHAPLQPDNLLGENMIENAGKFPSTADYIKDYEARFINFLQGVHTVVFDTHFTDENLKPNWGHSTPNIALNYAIQAKINRLILFHHAPEDSDEMVYEKINSVSKRAQEHEIEVESAKEGDIWDLISA